MDFRIHPFITNLSHNSSFPVPLGLDHRKLMKATQQGMVKLAKTDVDVANIVSLWNLGNFMCYPWRFKVNGFWFLLVRNGVGLLRSFRRSRYVIVDDVQSWRLPLNRLLGLAHIAVTTGFLRGIQVRLCRGVTVVLCR